MIKLSHLPTPENIYNEDFETLLIRQRIFGYTKEDLMQVMLPKGKVKNRTPPTNHNQPARLFSLFGGASEILASLSGPLSAG